MRFPSKERGCLSVTFHISLLVRVAEAWMEEGRKGQIRHNQTFMHAKFIYFLTHQCSASWSGPRSIEGCLFFY